MLESLEIKNFRILEDFRVPTLGKVNLIVGKNNSGKSSVLEALRIYAGDAQRELLKQIAEGHDEKYHLGKNEQIESDIQLPFEDFFVGRQFPQDETLAISIGELALGDDALRIEHGFLFEEEVVVKDDSGEIIERSTRRRRMLNPSRDELSLEAFSHALFVTKGERSFPPIHLDKPEYPRLRSRIEISGTLPCSVIPTQFISIDDLADEWDKIVFTEHEEVVRQALRIITPEFENLTFVRKDELPRNIFSRFAKVKMSDSPHPVPLNSLGDGMLRVLQLVLKVFPAKGGFLLIDEFENGLHFSVQEKVWALLFEMAQKLDIQIFATTHSWDCIESFAKVAIERKDVEGVLFRVGQSAKESNRGKIIATVFDEDALYNITQADVEVR
ncbi:MAG: AAA family ATPase [ANME-2 cluster archaeon]|jgi:AAA15 family ATPase/GTPase|nr:AAA family ATPase [ANME-2 cluster archaeon]